MFLFCIDPYTLYVATCTQGDLDLFTSYEVTSGTHVNDTCTCTSLFLSLSLSLSLCLSILLLIQKFYLPDVFFTLGRSGYLLGLCIGLVRQQGDDHYFPT